MSTTTRRPSAYFGVKLEKTFLQSAQDPRQAVLVQLELQLVADREEDFVTRQRRIGEINGFDRRGQPFHQHSTQHRLAAADFARDLDDAFVMGDGVEQCFERGAPVGPLKEKIGMRRDAERRLFQPEVL